MPEEKQTVRYDNIEDIPASALMQLTFTELTGFIREAERRIEKAKTLRNWLTWIKIEKALRNKPSNSTDGGVV